MNKTVIIAKAIVPAFDNQLTDTQNAFLQKARDVETALNKAGFAIVPRKPTKEMLEAVPDNFGLMPPLECLEAEYTHMIDTALNPKTVLSATSLEPSQNGAAARGTGSPVAEPGAETFDAEKARRMGFASH